MSASRLDGWGWVFAVFGVGFLANALWMLAGHNHWWLDLPGVYFPAIVMGVAVFKTRRRLS